MRVELINSLAIRVILVCGPNGLYPEPICGAIVFLYDSMNATCRVPSRGAVRFARVSVIPVRGCATLILHRVIGVSYVLDFVFTSIIFVVATDAPINSNYNSIY